MMGTKSGTVSIKIRRRNNMKMDKELAQYIADYINEEMDRYNSWIDSETIMNAVDAFDGGAR
jgi:ATP-dependent protease ClpP protease subunit